MRDRSERDFQVRHAKNNELRFNQQSCLKTCIFVRVSYCSCFNFIFNGKYKNFVWKKLVSSNAHSYQPKSSKHYYLGLRPFFTLPRVPIPRLPFLFSEAGRRVATFQLLSGSYSCERIAKRRIGDSRVRENQSCEAAPCLPKNLHGGTRVCAQVCIHVRGVENARSKERSKWVCVLWRHYVEPRDPHTDVAFNSTSFQFSVLHNSVASLLCC